MGRQHPDHPGLASELRGTTVTEIVASSIERDGRTRMVSQSIQRVLDLRRSSSAVAPYEPCAPIVVRQVIQQVLDLYDAQVRGADAISAGSSAMSIHQMPDHYDAQVPQASIAASIRIVVHVHRGRCCITTIGLEGQPRSSADARPSPDRDRAAAPSSRGRRQPRRRTLLGRDPCPA